MFNSTTTQAGPLAIEDGTLSAWQLPFDKTASKRAYETATFGVG